jgi:protein-L-isoaspartate(D-aspartate) O-methyltransferase
MSRNHKESVLRNSLSRCRFFALIKGVLLNICLMILLFPVYPAMVLAQLPPGRESTGTNQAKLNWERPRFEERRDERAIMVATQMRDIYNTKILNAMREVPRHLFVPSRHQRKAYADHPLPIGEGQTISQPYIVAYMTEILDLQADDKVLEIGTGSGYHAATISELTPNVFTIEVLEKLAKQASERFKELGYKTITVREDDGYFGWPEEAPFDCIIVTCAAGHVPIPLIEQLAPGGRMIIPVGGVFEIQRLILVTKHLDGTVEHKNMLPVRFVPMIGHQDPG